MGKAFDKIPPNVLEAVCRAIGNISEGLSGTDINKYLNDCKIDNPTPDITKWKRLVNALDQKQFYAKNSNDILKFIQTAIHPARFVIYGDNYFSSIVASINEPLSFIGLEYGIDGVFRNKTASKTISDAQTRANTLMHKLEQRNVHTDIFKYCKPELLMDNYFHAVFETTKGVADRLRYLSDLKIDGAALVSEAFSSKEPILIINNFTDETDISEHKGFSNLLIGFFGMFRNTTAHVPKTNWIMTEQDALEIMTIASLCHRKLDKAHKIR
ncbi:TIGR02391 family protein [Pedobacter frigiditerrae]|uniref:TIGR02391 family protein n=1 Tax=Pedobacter frigiditerrae TaxID=2530452 RepID=A0A4R0MXG2_9SPHI|nr:TIGR02391 family protein [Pedobacter frigiditerrae]TCC91920.1 TIGR02391 family protein [Pedobacter frigiditerrae]